MIMTYGWQDNKFVLLVQEQKDGVIIARISMKHDEARLVSKSIEQFPPMRPQVYENHEQIV